LPLYTSALKSLKEANDLHKHLSECTDTISASARLSIFEDEPREIEAREAPASSTLTRVASLSLGALHNRRQSCMGIIQDAHVDSQIQQAVLQKFNVAAFCIAAVFNDPHCLKLQSDHPEQNPFSVLDEIKTLTAADASKFYYKKAVLNGHEDLKSKVRLPALEDKEASIMRQFCVTQESETHEYANLLSQTLICLSAYLNQRSKTERLLHPHYKGVPHRHSQLFNRTWCRLAELTYEAPILRFALLQVIITKLWLNI
jgi:hypothetical protein